MRHSIGSLLLRICICLFIAQACAQSVDPYQSYESLLGFEIGKDTFEDIQANLGRSMPISPKEGEPFRICFVSAQQPRIFAEFQAMSSTTGLLAFSIFSDNGKFPEEDECVRSPKISATGLSVGKLRIGMTREQLHKILGKPSRIDGPWLHYYFKGKVMMDEEERKTMELQWPDEVNRNPYWDLASTIEVQIAKNRIVSIRVSKTKTY